MPTIKVTTPEFRVSYPSVFKPKHNKLSKKDEFAITALFPKGAELKVLKDACKKVIEEKWGTDQAKWPKNLRLPFKKQSLTRVNAQGETVANTGHVDGAEYLDLRSTQKPGVVDKNLQEIIAESDFYPGCWARATVTVYAYDQAGNRGVAFGLQNIQKTRDGDPLGGRVKPEMDFSPIEGTEASSSGSSANDLFN